MTSKRLRKKRKIILFAFIALLPICICLYITIFIKPGSSQLPDLPADEPIVSSSISTPGIANQKILQTESFLPATTHTETDFLFYYTASEYSYGITPDGYEIISFINSDGTSLEALGGGGTFLIGDNYGNILTESSRHVKNFKAASPNKITVYYDSNNAEQFTQYVFNDNNIEITANVDFPKEISNISSIHLQRDFLNGYIDSEKKVASDWVYPEKNDFPYKTFDSYVLTNYIDSAHKLYSFWRDASANPQMPLDYYSDCNFTITDIPDAMSTYSLSYTIVLEDLTRDLDPDYYALFKGQNSELAVGITPDFESVSSSTLFCTNRIPFNINITNLCQEDISYDIRYCIYDYYGNVYHNTQTTENVSKESQINYLLNFSTEQNGIYYLDTLVSYMGKEYHELFPFILYEPHDYQYVSTSPFGISGVRFNPYLPNDDTVYLAKEMGIANMRVCVSLPDYIGNDYTLLENYLSQLQENGTKITGQYLLSSDWTIPNDTDKYASELATILSHVGHTLTDCEIGNENNIKFQTSDMQTGMKQYLNQQFNPTFSVVTQDYELPIISAGVYLSKTDWLDAAVSSGLWNQTDTISTHAYSFPHSPDLSADPAIDHSFESALVRIRNFMDSHGEKTWYLSEFGYPTTPGDSTDLFSGSDLRSQADYTIREYILGLSYGVDVLESYAFYDGVNTTKGMNDDNCEYHYGMFYNEEYFGRIMPKPLVSAYMTMTQKLDGYLSCTEVRDISSTSRVFEIKLQQTDNPLYICWSNCKPLSTDTSFSRTPGLPWTNQWSASENITFHSDSYVVVTDFQGNSKTYYPQDGIVSIPVSGEPIIIENATLP